MAGNYAASSTSDREFDGDVHQAYGDDNMELNLLPDNGSRKHRYWVSVGASQQTSTTLSKRSQLWIYGQMAAFYISALVFMGIHLVFYNSLNDEPVVSARVSESLQTALGNILAILVEISLISGISVAYDQALWRLFRRKTLKASIIDKLATLVSSPWNLFRKDIISTAPLEWLLGLSCFLVAIAAVFPPGALTVENKPDILEHVRDIPWLNITNWGDGSVTRLADRALFLIDVDLVQRGREIRADLKLIANGVLSFGAPLHPACYDSTSCRYTLRVIGPSFGCSETDEEPKEFSSCNLLYEAKDHATTMEKHNRYAIVNNSFTISWRNETPTFEQSKSNRCVKPRNINCKTTFGTWQLNISRTQSRGPVFESFFDENDSLRWTNDLPIITNFHDFFWKNGELNGVPHERASDLTMQFTRTQAFAIRDAAVQALVGNVTLSYDPFEFPNKSSIAVPYLVSRETLVLGSPFVNLSRSLQPVFNNISSKGLETYLRDVTISAMERLSTEVTRTIVREEAETFVFSEPLQFYGPYAACLLSTLFIYALGVWSLRLNGASAGNSFLQWVTTTRVSESLDLMAKHCSPGGQENFSQDLKNSELRFGIMRGEEETEVESNKGIAGFGLVDEVERYHDV